MKKNSSRLFLPVLAAVLLTLFISALLAVKYAEEISALKTSFYERIADQKVPSLPAELSDFRFEASDDPDVWYRRHRLIRHAGGGLDGLSYLNAREAVLASLSSGESLVEMDFDFTSDGTLVCMHEWFSQTDFADVPDLESFLSTPIYGKYTPLTAEDLIDLMRDYPSLLVVIDTKNQLLPVLSELIRLSDEDEALLSRFVIQLYHPGEKADALALWPFPEENFLLTIYKLGLRSPVEALLICVDESVPVVTVPEYYFNDEELQVLTDHGCLVFEHTLNRPDHARRELSRGVYGLYTDFLVSADLF